MKLDSSIFQQISGAYQTYNKKTEEDIIPLYQALEDPNVEYSGKPILVYAAQHADHAAVEILLAAGADAAYLDEYGSGPLHRLAGEDKRSYAPWADEREAVRLLVEAGASPLRKNSDGSTCVHIAAQRGKLAMLEALAQAGKKLDLTDKKGWTALHHACDQAARDAGSYYNYAKKNYDKAMAASSDGSDYGEKSLAETRQRLKEVCDKEWARVEQRFGVIRCLLDAGLDPDQKDNYGKTPKDIAFDCQDTRVAALLAGTYVQGAEEDESTRLAMDAKGMDLMQAVEKRDHSAVEALLRMGASPNELYGGALYHNSFSLQGKVPMTMACVLLDDKLVSLLLAHGADPNFRDAGGKIPLAYTLGVGVNVNTNTFKNRVPESILQAMVEKGLDPDREADEAGNTLLNLCCKYVDGATGYNSNTLPGKLIQLLLRYKADPNTADNNGSTPLMPVCKGSSGYMEGIQLSLLEAGARVDAQDKEGSTPLMYAAQNRSHAMAKTMAEMLFEFGDPLPGAVNNAGQTALALASEAGNENLVQYLLAKA